MEEATPQRVSLHNRIKNLEQIVLECQGALEHQIAINAQYSVYMEELESKSSRIHNSRCCGLPFYFHPASPVVLPWTALFSLALLPLTWYLWHIVPSMEVVTIANAQAAVTSSLAMDYPSLMLALIDQAIAVVTTFLYANDVTVTAPYVGSISTCMQDNRMFVMMLLLGFAIGSWVTSLAILIPGSRTEDSNISSKDPHVTLTLPSTVQDWVSTLDDDDNDFFSSSPSASPIRQDDSLLLRRVVFDQDDSLDEHAHALLEAELDAADDEDASDHQHQHQPQSEGELIPEDADAAANDDDEDDEEEAADGGLSEAQAAVADLMAAEQFDSVIELCDAVIALLGPHPALHAAAAKAHYRAAKGHKRAGEAAKHLDRVCEAVRHGDAAVVLLEGGSWAVQDKVDAYKWAAVAHSEYATTLPLTPKLEHARVFYQHTQAALSLSPLDATLQLMMGRYLMTIAKLSWVERAAAKVVHASLPVATYEDAHQHFVRAYHQRPEWPLNLLSLSQCLLAMKPRDPAAKVFLQAATRCTPENAEDADAIEQAQELLNKF